MRSTLRIGRRPVLGLLAMLGLLAAMFAAIPAQAQPVPGGTPALYTGRAFAIGTNGLGLLGIPITDTAVGDTGFLSAPPPGGTVTSAPGVVTIGTLINATVLNETATGAANLSSATSQITGVTIPGVLAATALTANSGVNCAGPTTASSSIATLTIAGATPPVTIATAPNTTVTVLNAAGLAIATLTFNRQSYDPATNKESVDALVVTFPSSGPLAARITGSVILSHAESNLECTAPPTPTPSASPSATPSATPSASPSATPNPGTGLPNTGAGPGGQSPMGDGTLLAVFALLLVAASTGGLFVWRRRSDHSLTS